LTLKNIAKKIGKCFGKQTFLAIFPKFGTIWQPWAYPTFLVLRVIFT